MAELVDINAGVLGSFSLNMHWNNVEKAPPYYIRFVLVMTLRDVNVTFPNRGRTLHVVKPIVTHPRDFDLLHTYLEVRQIPEHAREGGLFRRYWY